MAPYEVECTYLSKEQHSKALHISVAEKKEPTFLIAYAEIIVRLCYPSTVTKVDWMWDNYVHSSSYGAFLLCNFNENKKVFEFAFIFAFLNPHPLRDVFSRVPLQLNDRPKVIRFCDDMSESTLR